MDRIDEQILRLLKGNGRMTSSEIGKHVHLSIPAVSERICKMEERGLIEQFSVKINREKMGFHLLAFIMVQLEKPEHIQAFRTVIQEHEQILECHHIAGEYDYLLKTVSRSPSDLERLISDTVKQVKGVVKTSTLIALSTVKEER
ncbi:Lrp/AsnC family transcriptional regulator [Brevibacillus borstelensis]|uniref:Lrp/AsnC family transcriptional regulator n=1 Tax=Brevibacillus borstelensis TaxID=45462 RepID=UPI0030C3C702